jgi:transcriptional regulator with XRE-family HTH domain
MKNNKTETSYKLKDLRKALKKTLRQIEAESGIGFTTFAKLERHGLFNAQLYLRLADYFQVDVRKLLEANKPRKKQK